MADACVGKASLVLVSVCKVLFASFVCLVLQSFALLEKPICCSRTVFLLVYIPLFTHHPLHHELSLFSSPFGAAHR